MELFFQIKRICYTIMKVVSHFLIFIIFFGQCYILYQFLKKLLSDFGFRTSLLLPSKGFLYLSNKIRNQMITNILYVRIDKNRDYFFLICYSLILLKMMRPLS